MIIVRHLLFMGIGFTGAIGRAVAHIDPGSMADPTMRSLSNKDNTY
jgi:hypothetical protein